MTRVPPIDPASAPAPVQKVLKAQAEVWGAPLLNHLLYGRRLSLFRAVRGMWTSLNQDQLLDEGLVALVNRRVASLNGCVF